MVFGGGDSPGLGSTLNRVSVSWVGGWGVWSVVVTQNFGQPADTFLRIRASSRPSPWLPCSGAALPTHMRCKALEPLWFRRLRRAAHFVRVVSGQLVDSKKARPRARPHSGALSTRRAIGLSCATQSSSTPVGLSAAAAALPARRASDLEPATPPGIGNDSLPREKALCSFF